MLVSTGQLYASPLGIHIAYRLRHVPLHVSVCSDQVVKEIHQRMAAAPLFWVLNSIDLVQGALEFLKQGSP